MPALYPRRIKVALLTAVAIEKKANTGYLSGWGDFVNDHVTQLYKQPGADKAFTIQTEYGERLSKHDNIFPSYYDSWICDALQDEMSQRSGYLVSIWDIAQFNELASQEQDYIASLARAMYVLQEHLQRLGVNAVGLKYRPIKNVTSQ